MRVENVSGLASRPNLITHIRPLESLTRTFGEVPLVSSLSKKRGGLGGYLGAANAVLEIKLLHRAGVMPQKRLAAHNFRYIRVRLGWGVRRDGSGCEQE